MYFSFRTALAIVNLHKIHHSTLSKKTHTQTHTDHPNYHTQIKKLQKGTFGHWFSNTGNITSEVFNEVHNYLNQNNHLRAIINRRFGTLSHLKLKPMFLS